MRNNAIWAQHIEGDPDLSALEGQRTVNGFYLALVSELLAEEQSGRCRGL
jgi:hypothetical protein